MDPKSLRIDRQSLIENTAAIKASEVRRAKGELEPGEIVIPAVEDELLIEQARKDGITLERNLSETYRRVRGLTSETLHS